MGRGTVAIEESVRVEFASRLRTLRDSPNTDDEVAFPSTLSSNERAVVHALVMCFWGVFGEVCGVLLVWHGVLCVCVCARARALVGA